MRFGVILNHNDTREFKKISYNGRDCILGTPKGVDTGENMSVLNQDITYPSDSKGKVLYPVSVGDYIIVSKKENGTIHAGCYKVFLITDTEVIGGPC